MIKTLDLILVAISVGGAVALVFYKLVLLFRYRNDPAKREAVVWSGQLFPKRLAKFVFDEDAETRGRKASPPTPPRK